MSLMLCGQWAPDEAALWRACLAEAMPGEVLLVDDGARSAGGAASPGDFGEVEIALVANPAPGSLRRWPALRLIQSLWAGVDRLLADPTLPPGVPIARMVDPAMNDAMAETALWAVLSLQRDFFRYARQQAGAQWRPWPQRRADETRLTLLGLGQMGRTVARRLAAQGYRTHGWRLGARLGEAAAAGMAGTAPTFQEHHGAGALPGLLARSDIVINLLPLTPATRGLLDARFFDAMPQGAALVNLARGGHVVEADLRAALQSGRLRHAVLDVFATEPLPASHWAWSQPGVSVLPHVAAQTDPRSAARVVAANVAALRAGLPLHNVVQRERGY